jgi:metal-sulfur cluster biosynthetic enzyme
MTDTDMRGWPTEDTATQTPAADGKIAGVAVGEDGMPSTEDLRTALKAVMDPEIGINIVDLGLVYDIVKEPAESKAVVEMTLTSMGCPLTELIHQQCTLVLTRLPGVELVDVNFVFSPPWSTEMISDEAKDELRAMGFNV